MEAREGTDPGKRRSLLLGGWLLLLAAAGLAGWGAHFAFPADFLESKYAVKLRNAFLAEPGRDADFAWAPPAWPAGFRRESQPLPEPLQQALAAIRPAEGETARGLALAEYLQTGRRTRESVLSSTLVAFQEIMANRRGYCADFTQVFNAIGHGMGLAVREWGMSFDGYGGDGHAFSEVYDPALGDWVFIDSYWSFHVRDRASGRPLSALAFRDRLLDGSAALTVDVAPIKARNFGLRSPERALAYYRRGASQFYLWMANDPLSFDAHPLMRALAGTSRGVQQAAAILIGRHPTFRVVPSPTSAADLAELSRLRQIVIATMAAVTVIAGGGITCLVLARRTRRAKAAARIA